MQRRTALLCPVALLASGATLGAAAISTAPARRNVGSGVTHRPLTFPADFGAHPDSRTEWWYATGVLRVDGDLKAPPFGFQVTFFRSRTGVPDDHPSAFAARQIVFAHAAVSDTQAARLRNDQRVARAGFGIAEASRADTLVQLRHWRLARSGPVGASRYHASVVSDAAGFALDLQLVATQPLLLQGDAGYSRKGPDEQQASRYYSQPQLAASGRLTLDGKPLTVHGRAWLDHEWSDSLLAPDAVGWDWIGINLDDGGALTAFRLRRADGSTVYAGGSLRAPGAAVRSFGPEEVRFTPERRWTSPHTQAAYPVAWTIDLPTGRYRLAAVFDDQELDSRRSTGSAYWEGLSTLRDAAGLPVGTGYLEMTGYAGKLQL